MSAAQRVSRGFHRLGLFLAAICIIWPTACLAQDIVVSGVGAFSCGQLAQDYSTLSDVEAVWFTWAQGFMSGLNMKMGIDQHQYRNLGAMTVEEQKRFLTEATRHAHRGQEVTSAQRAELSRNRLCAGVSLESRC
jgi:hypothetical protein